MLDRHSYKARIFLVCLMALLLVLVAGIQSAAAHDIRHDRDHGSYYGYDYDDRAEYRERHRGKHRHWRKKHRSDKYWRRHYRKHHSNHHRKHKRVKVIEHHHYHYDAPDHYDAAPPRRVRHDFEHRRPRFDRGIAQGRCDGALRGGIFGAGAGAAIGAAAGEGDPAVVAVATLAGVLVGSALGQAADAQDRYCLGQTFDHAPDGSTITWDDPKRRTRYEVTPQASYETDNGRYCREFTSTARVAGRAQQVYGTACWQPDGSWEIVEARR